VEHREGAERDVNELPMLDTGPDPRRVLARSLRQREKFRALGCSRWSLRVRIGRYAMKGLRKDSGSTYIPTTPVIGGPRAGRAVHGVVGSDARRSQARVGGAGDKGKTTRGRDKTTPVRQAT
jgi:hypothetical protein